jgi:Glucose / Sorbosone dehydrogenase
MKISTHFLMVLGLTSLTCAQTPAPTRNPFPQPLEANEGVIKVQFVEFASLPTVPGQEQPARMMLLLDEPGTGRLFVNDMVGPLYTVSYDGKTVTPYLDVNAAEWGVSVQSQGSERGVQSFAIHPQFAQKGSPGYGKFYTYTDTSNMTPTADFKMTEKEHTHDTVLLEWTAKTPSAATYDGGKPRELMRWAQPYGNHNGGHLTFNPLATPRDADYGLLYLGIADGGSGGDPFKVAQNLKVAFGKILRIDPLGTNSANGKYGIPPSNPFAKNGTNALGEIYAYGIRNAQRLFWDSKNHNMFMSEIGQNAVEQINPVTPGANLGWNVWEGSLRFYGREGVLLGESRADPEVTYPIAEYDHSDPLLLSNAAAIGGFVYRHTAIPQLTGKLIFGDNPSGEIFYVSADNLPKGGSDAIRRVLFDDNGTSKTLLQLIQEKNTVQGEKPANRADLRFGEGPDGKVFILNKRDGTIRMLVPDGRK